MIRIGSRFTIYISRDVVKWIRIRGTRARRLIASQCVGILLEPRTQRLAFSGTAEGKRKDGTVR